MNIGGKDTRPEAVQKAEVEALKQRFEEMAKRSMAPQSPTCPPDVLEAMRAGAEREKELVKAREQALIDAGILPSPRPASRPCKVAPMTGPGRVDGRMPDEPAGPLEYCEVCGWQDAGEHAKPSPESLVIPSEPRPDRAEQDGLPRRRPLAADQPRVSIRDLTLTQELVGSDPDPLLVRLAEHLEFKGPAYDPRLFRKGGQMDPEPIEDYKARILEAQRIADRSPPLNTPPAERVEVAGHPVDLTPGQDGMVCAAAPGIPGCFSQGEDRAAALANIEEAIAVSEFDRPHFTASELRRRRKRLVRRLEHLQERENRSSRGHAYDVAETSALQTALALFDGALDARATLDWLRYQAASIDADLPVAELDEAQLRGVVGVELLRLRRELSEARAEAEAERVRAGQLVAERAAMRVELDTARMVNQALAYPGRDAEGNLARPKYGPPDGPGPAPEIIDWATRYRPTTCSCDRAGLCDWCLGQEHPNAPDMLAALRAEGVTDLHEVTQEQAQRAMDAVTAKRKAPKLGRIEIVGGDAEKLRELGLSFQNAVAKAARERALAIDKALRILAPGQRLAVHEDPATIALEMQYLGVGEQPELGKAWTIYEAPGARELEFMRAVLAAEPPAKPAMNSEEFSEWGDAIEEFGDEGGDE